MTSVIGKLLSCTNNYSECEFCLSHLKIPLILGHLPFHGNIGLEFDLSIGDVAESVNIAASCVPTIIFLVSG